MTRAYLRVWVYSICCSKIRNDELRPPVMAGSDGTIREPVQDNGRHQHGGLDNTQQTDSTESDAD